MKKIRLHFFLDYGCCFWCDKFDDDDEIEFIEPDELLSENSRYELNAFLKEYNASYVYGLPPYKEHDVEYCKRFNRELKRITDLIFPDLSERFVICHEQFELVEDEKLIAQAKENPAQAMKQRIHIYNTSSVISYLARN